MKSHKYWSIGALITMLGTFYTGYKGSKEGHKYFAASSLLCMIMAIYTGHKMISGKSRKKKKFQQRVLKIKKQNILINNAGAGFDIQYWRYLFYRGLGVQPPNILFVFCFGKFVKDPLPIDNYFIIIAEILEIIAV